MGFSTAFAVVVASMVGAGVFTTLGLQAVAIHDGAALLSLWLLGGVIALCGALCYGELAAALPRSGGEYHFLGRIYHPVLGTVAGWVSVTVGFCAPVALTAMALGRYAADLLPLAPGLTAAGSVVLVSLFHVFNVRTARRFHVITTVFKIVLIGVFLVAGLVAPPAGDVRFGPPGITLGEILSPAFALSLVYVSYAYAGWNAATYVAGEIAAPQRVIPRALFYGTMLVTLFYVLLNLVFLRSVPLAQLSGRIEVGALAAVHLFGEHGAMLMNAMLCVLLISTISAMVLAGPRVLQVIGEDVPALRMLAARTRGGAPRRAIVLQQGLALILVATGSFEAVLTYAGFALSVFSVLTVLGVAVLRYNEPGLPRPYRVPGYPFTPAFFVLVNTLILGVALYARPLAAGGALATVGLGLAIALARHRRLRGDDGSGRTLRS